MAWIKNERLPSIRPSDVRPEVIFRKLYRPLGEIAFMFADLESRLTRTLNLLLGLSKPSGTALESLMQNVSLRIELFYFMALRPIEQFPQHPTGAQMNRAAAHAGLRKMAEAIYNELKQANSDRNNLLHGAWTGLSPDGLTYSKDRFQTGSGKLTEIPIRGISVELLKKEANYINSVSLRLVDWQQRARRWDRPDLWPPPLPETSLLRSPIGRLIQVNRKLRQKPPPAASPE